MRKKGISIGVFLAILTILIYWFSGEEKREVEKIIIPSGGSSIYRELPEVKSYMRDVERAIRESRGVVPLDSGELDSSGLKVQKLLLKNAEFLKDSQDFKGNILHSDIMSIRPAIISVMNSNTKGICQRGICYQAEKYNFVTNTTTRAIVEVTSQRVLQIDRFPNMQPDISLKLTHVAQAIALNAPEVKAELGGEKPKFQDMSMANVRGGLHNSPCENQNHLCVAPTFAYHEREEALWAIVDLSELKLAVAKWAGLGKTTTPSCISERTLQNRYIMENFCRKDTHYSANGWSLKYRITGSDGLEIVDASFNGDNIIKSMKIVDWHVAYKGKGRVGNKTQETYVAGRRVEYVRGRGKSFYFGYNDAMGCPMFSTSVVLPFNAPTIKPILKDKRKIGFSISQDYRNPKWPMACNYRYENRFDFYSDGSFRIVGINKGRGCGENAIYRPVMRIDLALSDKEKFYSFKNRGWRVWKNEGLSYQSRAKEYFMGKYLYKVLGGNRGYYIEPNRGQFGDNSRGDNAKLFVTLYKESEGANDLLTLGSCCKLNEDGVEQYIKPPENIEDKDIVIWYVPHIQNDARKGHEYCWADTILENGQLAVKVWPCVVGPKFIPIAENFL